MEGMSGGGGQRSTKVAKPKAQKAMSFGSFKMPDIQVQRDFMKGLSGFKRKRLGLAGFRK